MPQIGNWADIYETWLSIKGMSSVNFLTDENGEEFWFGANDIDIEDDWVWESDKSKLLFSNWLDGEPNNYVDEDCGIMRWHNSQYRWNDGDCQRLYLYICEK